MLPNIKVNTELVYKENSKSYSITLKSSVYRKALFYKVFRTDFQIKNLLIEATKSGIIEAAKSHKNLNSLTFTSKEESFVLLFDVKQHPCKEKIGGLINIYHFSRLNDSGIQYIEKYTKPANRYELKEYSLPYRIVPRNEDMHILGFNIKDSKCKGYISKYVMKEKDWFTQRFYMDRIFMGLSSIFSQKKLFEKHLDNCPFNVIAIDERTSEHYFLTLSLSSLKYIGETYYAFLLDNVAKMDIKSFIKRAEDSNETIYKDLNLHLKRIETGKERKTLRNGGLKIIKKAEK